MITWAKPILRIALTSERPEICGQMALSPCSSFADLLGAFEQGFGVAGPTEIAQRETEVAQEGGDGGVVGPVGNPGPGSPNRLLFSRFTQWGPEGDYNGDGTTDLTVWRPSEGNWYLRGIGTVRWGIAGDIPVPGDYNGDGVTDLAVWRPSEGNWYVRGQFTTQWGVGGAIPLAS